MSPYCMVRRATQMYYPDYLRIHFQTVLVLPLHLESWDCTQVINWVDSLCTYGWICVKAPFMLYTLHMKGGTGSLSEWILTAEQRARSCSLHEPSMHPCWLFHSVWVQDTGAACSCISLPAVVRFVIGSASGPSLILKHAGVRGILGEGLSGNSTKILTPFPGKKCAQYFSFWLFIFKYTAQSVQVSAGVNPIVFSAAYSQEGVYRIAAWGSFI